MNDRIICHVFVVAAIGCASLSGAEPDVQLLWPHGAPGTVGDTPADKPSLTVVLPDSGKATGSAVVICPGGAYGFLATDHEGKQPARWLADRGVAAFILQFRLAPRYKHPAPMQDAMRAIRYVRHRAKEMSIKPNQIGVWGFSAGGHLASTAATHFDAGNQKSDDPIERLSSRPDFAILAYPVIVLDRPFTHAGSRDNLLGKDGKWELREKLSNDRMVTKDTPPTFLFHTTEDTVVPPENSAVFYLALRKAKVPAELHIFQKGRHGVGLAQDDPVLRAWPERLEDWLRIRGLARKP